ncbi:UNVERIFIED_CONTAM: hypothetical protein Sangu_0507400 [Sesamum angustifolium]|uniref:DUF569 domain-containing protein n=1 Tax=Sesamum angustifolium TaxID=2727405 RepID=A0AAW2Q8L0_9LAMI
MELFQRAKAVRLKCSHDKYLTAEEDEESVTQDRNGSSRAAKWTVEFVDHSEDVIRLKSCYGKYLTASNQPFLLGMTGRKVLQTLPKRLDSSVEWEPVRDNGAVKLKTRYGQFLRANGGLPPWRNSVTHDIPHRTATQEWILWEVHVVEILEAQSPAAKPPPPLVVEKEESFASESSSPARSHSSLSAGFSRQEGSGVEELTRRLEEELGVDGITVCARSPLNGKLYPLRLHLPPNNATMHVVVVPPSSQGDLLHHCTSLWTFRL